MSCIKLAICLVTHVLVLKYWTLRCNNYYKLHLLLRTLLYYNHYKHGHMIYYISINNIKRSEHVVLNLMVIYCHFSRTPTPYDGTTIIILLRIHKSLSLIFKDNTIMICKVVWDRNVQIYRWITKRSNKI